MELRAPFSPEAKALRQSYIRDDIVVGSSPVDDQEAAPVPLPKYKPGRNDEDLQSEDSPSDIGKLVYKQVFCVPDDNPWEQLQNLLRAVLELLKPHEPLCPANGKEGGGSNKVQNPLWISELERHPHIIVGNFYYLLPEKLEQIDGLIWFPQLLRAIEVMEKARTKFHLSKLVKELRGFFAGKTLREVVFQGGSYSDDFRATKRTLFDTLYLLYILRRRAPVNLEYVIEGLRVLHVVEALAVDSLITAVKAPGPLSPSDEKLRKTLEILFPELQGWNGKDPLTTLPLIQSKADFEAYFTATPIVHPIFARLHWFKRLFNDIKPIGIGDLKVVKQWLLEYLPGEISYVENVLKGETRSRTHRHLEKSEDIYSSSSSAKESSQKDTQSNDRFELKTEVENVVKTDLNVGANASFTYDQKPITATVSASFGYKRDTSDQSKTASAFSRETISKAMQQVEKNVSEQRSATKLFETEETNVHSFENNQSGAKHISGIYRWLDKKYKAQLFNYGKRMMFEFVIPEPAAFFVESRLHAFESTLECPQPPAPPKLADVNLGFTIADLPASAAGKAKFQELQQKYDLADLSFPELTMTVDFLNQATGENYFEKTGLLTSDWSATTYHCKLNAKNYALTKLFVDGYAQFHGKGNTDPTLPEKDNTFVIMVNGAEIARRTNESALWWPFSPAQEVAVASPTFDSDDVTLTLGTWDGDYYRLSIRGDLTLSDESFARWQTDVFRRIYKIEQQKVEKDYQEALLKYNTRMSTYVNRLDELKAMAVNDLLQGQEEAFNREIIATELKKHCLTMLTKEFDSDDSDDVLSKIDGVQDGRLDENKNKNNFTFHKFEVKEDLKALVTTGSFELKPESVKYPFIVLDEAKEKGRFIQFLEQAFEWQQLAYIFYPYFWATPPRWIEMMNRLDKTDANMTAFLRAGSVRVLLAVTPAYDQAVLHFIATREPWDGGPSPVLGDPLFIPLYEEIRKKQDDLYNAVPQGEPWTFTLPTSLVYLDDSGAKLPTFPDVPTS
jgi:hypothetical protein